MKMKSKKSFSTLSAKGLVVAWFSLIAITTPAATADHAHHSSKDHPSVHGMLMVGSHSLYLSHLPMFHSPHDYQALFAAELDSVSMRAYLESQTMSDETVYTLVPEVFVLPDMVSNPRSFKAQIFKGHFERSGKMIAGNATVTLKKVLHFRKLKTEEIKLAHSGHLLFGNAKEQFLAHMIHGRPDFDQILRVQIPEAISSGLNGSKAIAIESPTRSNNEPLKDLEIFEARIPGDITPIPVQVEKSLYLEFGDLAL